MKVVIDHIAGSRRGQRQELDSLRKIRFGRHPDNEVTFDAHRDLDASSRHAELVREGDQYVLADIGSSNGLLVDGERVVRFVVPLGQALEVSFGAAGPRVRLFIGDPDDIPDPPSASSLRLPRTVQSTRPDASHTMAMMWREASARSGGRGFTFLRVLAHEAVHKSSRRFKIVVSLVVTVLLAAIGVLVVWQLGERSQLERDRREAGEQRAGQDRERAIREEAERRDRVEGPGPTIATEFGDAVYLLVVEASRDEPSAGFCTGFAVTETHLATNAHCVEEARGFRREGRKVTAVRNGAAEHLATRKLLVHPRYRGGLSEDVGLIELATPLPTVVRLASADRLRELRKGANVFALGFPARLARELADGESPEATIVDGIIGRITTFDGERGRFEEELLVQHNLQMGAGTSGSAVFDGFGNVVAVNAGSYTESMTDVVVDPKTGEGRKVRRRVLTPGANYAVRIDALREVLRENDLDVPHGGGKPTDG